MNLKTAWLINSNIEVDDLKKTMDDDAGLDFWASSASAGIISYKVDWMNSS